MGSKNRTNAKKLKQRRLAGTTRPGIQAQPERLRPRTFEGESPEDAAVFAPQTRASLSPELAQQAEAIAEALRLVYEGADDEAKRRINDIPRSSPYSEWRLFLRGLIVWYAGEIESASQFWDRLDSQRRPAKMARALKASEQGSAGSGAEQALASALKTVRTIRIDRPALAQAFNRLAKLVDRADSNLSVETINWLKEFCLEHRATESAFVKSLEQNAIQLAFEQDYVDVFELVCRNFNGPPYDPAHTFRKSLFYGKFEDGGDESDEYFKQYLEKELPVNTKISEQLRGALLSYLHLQEAMDALRPDSNMGMFNFLLSEEKEDTATVEKHFRAAVKAYPAHAAAHSEYLDWVQSKVDNERLKKPERDRFEKKLPIVMVGWNCGLPDAIEPRLWLVDYYFENEDMEKARPQVDWLAASRHDDPRVRATPWKWELLEAMRLCRRKQWLAQVPEKLVAVDSLWPTWLPKDWLPFLHAAYALRSSGPGDTQGQALDTQVDLFPVDEIRPVIDEPNKEPSLTESVMRLAAAQRMRVPASDLKPLRETVEHLVDNISTCPLNDLVNTGSFLWDLNRLTLLYPAYRNHASKIGRELLERLKALPMPPKVDGIEAAVLWMSQHRFWPPNYGTNAPHCIRQSATSNRFMAASMIHATLKERYTWNLEKVGELVVFLDAAAKTEKDRYYRFWFADLVRQVAERRQKESSRLQSTSSFAELFGRMTGAFGGNANVQGEDEDEDDDEWDEGEDNDDQWGELEGGLDYNPECDCPKCMAAKARAAIKNSAGQKSAEQEESDLNFRFDTTMGNRFGAGPSLSFNARDVETADSAVKPFRFDSPSRPGMSGPSKAEERRNRKNPFDKKNQKKGKKR